MCLEVTCKQHCIALDINFLNFREHVKRVSSIAQIWLHNDTLVRSNMSVFLKTTLRNSSLCHREIFESGNNYQLKQEKMFLYYQSAHTAKGHFLQVIASDFREDGGAERCPGRTGWQQAGLLSGGLTCRLYSSEAPAESCSCSQRQQSSPVGTVGFLEKMEFGSLNFSQP